MQPPALPNTTSSENAGESSRYVTHEGVTWVNGQTPESTPPDAGMEEDDRFRLYSLCPCENCGGTGKSGPGEHVNGTWKPAPRCKECRGEGRSLSLIATATSKEAVGVALVTLAEEGEWDGDCPFGLMDRPAGEKGRWLLKPWQASTRNVTDAAKLLRAQQG